MNIKLPNNNTVTTNFIGIVQFSENLILFNVLYVLEFSFNLISVQTWSRIWTIIWFFPLSVIRYKTLTHIRWLGKLISTRAYTTLMAPLLLKKLILSLILCLIVLSVTLIHGIIGVRPIYFTTFILKDCPK